MYLTRTAGYAIRLSLSQSNSTQLYRSRSSLDLGTASSAFFLATLGLSVSMFSLKQMLSQMPQNRHRRLH